MLHQFDFSNSRTTADFDRKLVVFSDIEMGAGGRYDDFPHSDFLGEILLGYVTSQDENVPIDFVFNGDTFDLLKTPYMGTYPRHVTKDVALSKMASIIAAHPKFFEALRKIISHPSGNKNFYFVVGNHDMEILFPEIQDLIKSVVGSLKFVHFPGFEVSVGPVLITHGSQFDPLFYVDPQKTFVELDGEKILNISWASVALLDVIMPLQPMLYHQDRLKPKKRVLDLYPEIKELLMGSMWQYYSRDFFKNYLFSDDPVKKISWTMLKEIAWRFTNTQVDVTVSSNLLKTVLADNNHEMFVLGHLHETYVKSIENKRIVQMGCFRDEYLIQDSEKPHIPLLKNYIEVNVKGKYVVSFNLKEVMGPARSGKTAPEPIEQIIQWVREKQPSSSVITTAKQEQLKQEQIEAKTNLITVEKDEK